MTIRVETNAEEVIERPIKAVGNGAHVLVPKRWRGRIAKVVLMPGLGEVKTPVHPSWDDSYEDWKKCKTDMERLRFALGAMPNPNKVPLWDKFRIVKRGAGSR